MSKIEFCNLLFRYISDGFTKVDIETKDTTYMFDFDIDRISLTQDYFILPSDDMFDYLIYYEDVKTIRCC